MPTTFGLKQVAAAAFERAMRGADDADGDGVAEVAQGRADSEHGLARLEQFGIAELGIGGHFALDLDDGDVGQRVGPDQRGRRGTSILEDHFQRQAAFDHVVVGDGIALGRDDDARAGAALAPVGQVDHGDHGRADLFGCLGDGAIEGDARADRAHLLRRGRGRLREDRQRRGLSGGRGVQAILHGEVDGRAAHARAECSGNHHAEDH
jgi:hypothetical protein